MKKVKSLITMAAALALVGCSQDDLMQGVENHADGAIGVNAYVPTTTRGTALDSESDLVTAENGFDLFAFKSNNEQFMGTAENGIAFTGSGSENPYNWDYADKAEMRFWSEAKGTSLSFYAVSPMSEKTEGLTLTKNITAEARTVSYTVPTDCAKQIDLMYANGKENPYSCDDENASHVKNGIDLQFHHALSQILFKAKTEDKFLYADVTSVKVKGIKGQGSFNFTSSPAWTLDGNADVTYEVPLGDTKPSDINSQYNESGEYTATTNTGGNNQDGNLTDREHALLLLPQNGDMTLEISCSVRYKAGEDEEQTVVNVIDNKTIDVTVAIDWKAGTKYTYTLLFTYDMGKPIKVGTVEVDEWDNADGDANEDVDVKELPVEERSEITLASDGKFYIYNASQLADARNKINKSYDLSYEYNGQNYYYHQATYILKNDIDLSDYENWTSIGNETNTIFQGTFDGNQHTISNLKINSTDFYAGLFGNCYQCTIKNLKVDNPTNETYITISHSYGGGIIGEVNSAKEISNLSFKGKIQLNKIDNFGPSYTGGVIGRALDSDISNCTFEAGSSMNGISSYSGCIIGYFNSANKTISNCNNYGMGNWNADNSNPVGGIVGSIFRGSVENCHNYGNISGFYIGGVCGKSINKNTSVQYTGCSNSGKVTGTYCAGIVATISSSDIIQKCYNSGEVSGKKEQAGIVNDCYEGGNENTLIYACYNTGKLTGMGTNGNNIIISEDQNSATKVVNGFYESQNDILPVGYSTEEGTILFNVKAVDGSSVLWSGEADDNITIAMTLLNTAPTSNIENLPTIDNSYEFYENTDESTKNTKPLLLRKKQ